MNISYCGLTVLDHNGCIQLIILKIFMWICQAKKVTKIHLNTQ